VSSFSLLHIDSQYSLYHLLKKLFFLPLEKYTMLLAPLSKISLLYSVILFLFFLFCSTGLHVCFCASTIAIFITTALWYNLKLNIIIPPAVLFLLRITFAIQGLLFFHMNFRIGFSISIKNALKF
jgi:hypothetical protein